MMYVGIDIGIKGAIAFYNSLSKTIYTLLTATDREEIHSKLTVLPKNTPIFLEDLNAVYGSSATSTFSFGKSCGRWEELLTYLKFKNVHYVKPFLWQTAVTTPPVKPFTRGLPKKTRDKLNRDHKKALKKESCDALQRSLGIVHTDDNICDACNLARYAEFLYTSNKWQL